MKPVKTVTRFFLLLAFVYTLLMIPWPGLDRVYAGLFRSGVEFAVGSLRRDVLVKPQVRVLRDGGQHMAVVVVWNPQTGAARSVWVGCRGVGYAPAAFLTALLVATPLPWSRKVWPFFWGMVLIHAFVILNVSVTVVYNADSIDPAPSSMPGAYLWKALGDLLRFVFGAPFFLLVVPTFIWIFVTFRREDIGAMVGRPIARRRRLARS